MPFNTGENLFFCARNIPIPKHLSALTLMRRWYSKQVRKLNFAACGFRHLNSITASKVRGGLSAHNLLPRRMEPVLVFLWVTELRQNPLTLGIHSPMQLFLRYCLRSMDD